MSHVAGFLFNSTRNKVVLIKKNRPKWQSGRYNGVGGKFEEKDSCYEAAMTREFFEETGVKIPKEKWKLFCQYFWSEGFVCFYSCHDEYDQYFPYVKTVTDEELGIFDVSELPHNKIYNLNWLVPLANDPSLDFTKPMSWITISE